MISDIVLERIGQQILARIQERTLDGIDMDGKRFKAYSTKPFNMPFAPPFITVINKMASLNQAFYFKKNNNLWINIQGGYAALKASAKPNFKNVNLTYTGKMLNALTVTQVGNNRIKIGFIDKNQQDKMQWNIQKGRDPMGISDTELQTILSNYGINQILKSLIALPDGERY